MQHPRSLVLLAGSCLAIIALPMSGCDKKAPTNAPTPSASHDHDHDHADDHDHGDGHAHGEPVSLGEHAVGGMTIRAAREGEIKPGAETAFDITIASASAKIVAVRVWIGAEDARGSVKAKAQVEKGSYHAHAQAPAPLPEASKLWVEVETQDGQKHVAGFDVTAT